jgi:hypothetical protein
MTTPLDLLGVLAVLVALGLQCFLRGIWPEAQLAEIKGAGHMAPITPKSAA